MEAVLVLIVVVLAGVLGYVVRDSQVIKAKQEAAMNLWADARKDLAAVKEQANSSDARIDGLGGEIDNLGYEIDDLGAGLSEVEGTVELHTGDLLTLGDKCGVDLHAAYQPPLDGGTPVGSAGGNPSAPAPVPAEPKAACANGCDGVAGACSACPKNS